MFKKDPDPREISNTDAADVYKEPGVTFVDVREPDEWAEGHMPGAVHIPLGDLARRAGELPAEGHIITVCKAGGRSLKAVDILEEERPSGRVGSSGIDEREQPRRRCDGAVCLPMSGSRRILDRAGRPFTIV
jgi:rhodanese-related sulfurtransferase